MCKNIIKLCLTVVFVFVLSLAVCAAYPSSGKQAPDGSVLIEGKIIGEKFGWGGNEQAGCTAAFDGNTDTFYDRSGHKLLCRNEAERVVCADNGVHHAAMGLSGQI